MKDTLWLALSKVSGLGIKKLISLSELNNEMTVYDLASKSLSNEIRQIVRSNDIMDCLQDSPYMQSQIHSAEQSISEHKSRGIQVITYVNELYPKLLKLIPDPPIALYCKGNLEALQNTDNIAVIGTRNPTEKGLQVAEKVAFEFTKKGFAIVSGLAKGIDAAGHIGALKAQGVTIAIMAGGLEKIYPKENTQLAERIVNNNGLLVSENPIGFAMQRSSFVKRDRIQSGLSLGVCPVQTDVDGGSMHTVRYAFDQKRILFCPKILEQQDLPVYRGIIKIIHDYKAKVLETSQDYNKLIEIMKDNFYTINLENKKNKIIKVHGNTKKEAVVEENLQLDFDSIVTTDYNELIIDQIFSLIEKANSYGMHKDQLLKKIENAWEEVKK